jgi:hypothetical protein
VAFTIRQYVETDLEADREVVNTLASDQAVRPGPHERFVYRFVYKPQAEGRFPVREPASGLGSGAGFGIWPLFRDGICPSGGGPFRGLGDRLFAV